MKFLQKCMNVAMPGKNATKKQQLYPKLDRVNCANSALKAVQNGEK